MIAWTTSTPDMMAMAKEAARRIQFYGGVYTCIFEAPTKQECHRMKLASWLEFRGPAWHFDSDLFMLRQCAICQPSHEMLIGNPDNAPGGKYKGTCVDSTQAINSSLVGMDMSQKRMRDLVKRAMDIQLEIAGPDPIEDERFLNMAAWESPLMISRLSTRWNWCSINPPKDAIAVHAASQTNKLEWLNQAVKNYES